MVHFALLRLESRASPTCAMLFCRPCHSVAEIGFCDMTCQIGVLRALCCRGRIDDYRTASLPKGYQFCLHLPIDKILCLVNGLGVLTVVRWKCSSSSSITIGEIERFVAIRTLPCSWLCHNAMLVPCPLIAANGTLRVFLSLFADLRPKLPAEAPCWPLCLCQLSLAFFLLSHILSDSQRFRSFTQCSCCCSQCVRSLCPIETPFPTGSHNVAIEIRSVLKALLKMAKFRKIRRGKPHAHPKERQKTSLSSSSEDSEDSDEFEDYDMGEYNQVIGSATAADLAIWAREAATFIRSDSGLGDEWVGRKPLGKGSFGIAGLWARLDCDGRLVEVCLQLHVMLSRD